MRNIDFNKYQSALIIGNGFDLSLGLSTSYMDFVNSDEFQILLNMQNQLAIYLKVNAELHNKKQTIHILTNSFRKAVCITSSQLITIKNFGSFIIKKMATTV